MNKFKTGTMWQGQKIMFYTTLFGKEYFWMQDVDGRNYLAAIGEDGMPDLT